MDDTRWTPPRDGTRAVGARTVVAWAVVALAVVVGVGLLVSHDAGWHAFELDVDDAVFHGTPFWGHRVAATLQDVFAPVGGSFVVLVAVAVLLVRRRPGVAWRFALLAVIPWWATEALKLVVQRPRPAIDGSTFVDSPLTWSYPSGHAAAATAIVLALLWTILPALGTRVARAIAVGLGTVLVAAVMVSRVVLAVHYPTDVLAGPVAAAAFAALLHVLLGRVAPGQVGSRPGAGRRLHG